MTRRKPVMERLWAKVDVRGPDECWQWTGGDNGHGYGQIWADGKKWYVVRLVYAATYGPIEPGNVVKHSCDNPPCCNPAHHSQGTHAENSREMRERDRSNRRERNGNAKLTQADIVEIRASNGPSRAVASRFGIHDGTVRQIRRGDRWK